MIETGNRNGAQGVESVGLKDLKSIHWNLNAPELYEAAISRGEGVIAAGGALAVDTGVHTGRAAADKYIVRDEVTQDAVWWGNNKPLSPTAFERLLDDFRDHAAGRELFVQDLHGGADSAYRVRARVMSEYAWHSLFIRNLLIMPDKSEAKGFRPDITIVNLPSFRADPARHECASETIIAFDLQRNIVLIGGTSYAGEMKKSVFSVLNFLLPPRGVMPMHCSANVGAHGDAALFFGLSGTGKTTLSADPARTLIGDDEHGWGADGIFNFEGGCYAKTIRLSPEAEPQIHATTQRFGTVLENVVLGPDRFPDFDDGSKTENTRCAYPLHFIASASDTGIAGHPANVIMLTADAFGVMPPIARLTPAQAMYHFLSGYTAKVAGTEKGVVEPEATFSTCFGAPFMPRHPSEYGELLRDCIARHGSDCWLVNTGWTGGAYGVGSRMPIGATRALLSAALDGSLNNAEYRTDSNFGFEVPVAVQGVERAILDPRSTWADGDAYDAQAARLVDMFTANFTKYEAHVDAATRDAAPGLRVAAQ